MKKRRHPIKRLLTRTLTFLVLAALATWLFLCAVGFPSWAIPPLLSVLSRGGFAVETRTIRLDLQGGAVLGDVRLHRKGVIGPPALEAASLSVRWLLWGALVGDRSTWHVRLTDGRFLPEQFVRRQPRTSGQAVGRTVAPPAHGTPGGRLRRAQRRVRVDLDRCTVWNVNVEHLSGDVELGPELVSVAGMEGYLDAPSGGGAFHGDAAYRPGEAVLDGTLSTAFDPRLLREVVESLRLGGLAWAMRRFEFNSVPPHFEFTFRRTFDAARRFDLQGRYAAQDCAYNGVNVLRVDGVLSVKLSPTNSIITLDPMLVVRDEGIARGGFTLDHVRGVAVFHGRSGLDPNALLQMVGVLKPGEQTPWRFDGPVEVDAEGWADMRGRDNTAFTAHVRGRDMTLCGFTAESARLLLQVTGRTNRVTDIEGSLYGGKFGGNVTFVDSEDPDEPTQYALSAHTKNSDFGRMARTLGTDTIHDYEGEFTADLRLSGRLGEGQGHTATGSGSVKIVRGQVFLMPIFGGFSELMTRAIPGLDLVLRQSDARASFSVANGKVSSDKVRIEGDVLSLTGKGHYALNGQLGFDVQVTLMKEHTLVAKLLRTVTYPISKLLEFRLEGTLQNPTWHSAILSGTETRSTGEPGAVPDPNPEP